MTLIEQQLAYEEEEKLKEYARQLEQMQTGLLQVQERKDAPPSSIENVGLLNQKGYTPNNNFGEHVSSPYNKNASTMGSIWNDFGDTIRQKFLDQGEDVPRKKLFPSDVRLFSTQNVDLPQRHPNFHKQYDGTDYQEAMALQKMGDGMEWGLRPDGRLRAAGMERPSIELYHGLQIPNASSETMLGVSKEGAMLSSPQNIQEYSFVGKNDKRKLLKEFQMPISNVTGHEYAHYLDNYFSNGNASLSDITEDLMLNDANGMPTQAELMESWMSDPRTEHLDVFDSLNTKPVSAKVNPREILGKFYTTSLVEENGNFENMRENIARSLQEFFGGNYHREGHGLLVTDQKKDVMSAVAKLLNNIPR